MDLIIGLTIFILAIIYLNKLNSRLGINAEENVKDYFISKNIEIINFESAHKNPKSPVFNKWHIAPSTGVGINLFKHRFYKVEIINSNNKVEINWVDCLYFFNYKCWFVVKKDETTNYSEK